MEERGRKSEKRSQERQGRMRKRESMCLREEETREREINDELCWRGLLKRITERREGDSDEADEREKCPLSLSFLLIGPHV